MYSTPLLFTKVTRLYMSTKTKDFRFHTMLLRCSCSPWISCCPIVQVADWDVDSLKRSRSLLLDSMKWIGCIVTLLYLWQVGPLGYNNHFFFLICNCTNEIAYSSWIRHWHSWVWQAQLQLIVLWSYLMTFAMFMHFWLILVSNELAFYHFTLLITWIELDADIYSIQS